MEETDAFVYLKSHTCACLPNFFTTPQKGVVTNSFLIDIEPLVHRFIYMIFFLHVHVYNVHVHACVHILQFVSFCLFTNSFQPDFLTVIRHTVSHLR